MWRPSPQEVTAVRQSHDFWYPHHGHAQDQRADEVDGRLALTLMDFMECVEEICPTDDPQQETKDLGEGNKTKHDTFRKTLLIFSDSWLTWLTDVPKNLKIKQFYLLAWNPRPFIWALWRQLVVQTRLQICVSRGVKVLQCSHRFEAVHDGHHDVAFVVLLEIEEVERWRHPKVDAGQPCQDRQLETLSEVGSICVERIIGYLYTTDIRQRRDIQFTPPSQMSRNLELRSQVRNMGQNPPKQGTEKWKKVV